MKQLILQNNGFDTPFSESHFANTYSTIVAYRFLVLCFMNILIKYTNTSVFL